MEPCAPAEACTGAAVQTYSGLITFVFAHFSSEVRETNLVTFGVGHLQCRAFRDSDTFLIALLVNRFCRH
jgi:hypothetical protein